MSKAKDDPQEPARSVRNREQILRARRTTDATPGERRGRSDKELRGNWIGENKGQPRNGGRWLFRNGAGGKRTKGKSKQRSENRTFSAEDGESRKRELSQVGEAGKATLRIRPLAEH